MNNTFETYADYDDGFGLINRMYVCTYVPTCTHKYVVCLDAHRESVVVYRISYFYIWDQDLDLSSSKLHHPLK